MILPELDLEPAEPVEPWMDDAACLGKDVNLFVREQGDNYTVARSVCSGCRVKEQCLAFAERTGTKAGMFGGLSPEERYERRLEREGRSHYSAGIPDIPGLFEESTANLARTYKVHPRTITRWRQLVREAS